MICSTKSLSSLRFIRRLCVSASINPTRRNYYCSTPLVNLKQAPFSYIPYRHLFVSTTWLNVQFLKVPPFAESVTEGDVIWKKAVGDTVAVDEVIGEVETDKTNVPLPSPCAGVIKALLVEDGGKVVAGQNVAELTEGASTAATTAEPRTEIEEKPVKAPPQPEATGPQTVVPPPVETPSGKPVRVIPPSPMPDSLLFTHMANARGEQRVKMSRMRLRIAQRLKDAQNTCAMLTTFNEIDMSNMLELRRQYKDEFLKKHGVKLGVMSTFAKASALALVDQPIVNAVIDETDIIYRDYIDISVAVATPKGLVVPVLRNVELMNYADVELAINELGVKARDGKLAVEDMDGGTFTISNGGVFGSLFGTPIINPPQSAILGIYGVFDRPVARNGQIVIKPMMYAALTYDHRLIDGREAVTFLRKIKSFVEDPRTFFLQL